jgi:hypothetical protein
MKIDEVGRWLPIVANEISHQNVEHVIVDGNGFAETRRGNADK